MAGSGERGAGCGKRAGDKSRQDRTAHRSLPTSSPFLPPIDGASENAATGLDLDPAAAISATVAFEAIAGTADFQTLTVRNVVHDAATVAHEGNGRLEEIRCLGGERRKRLLYRAGRWRC